MTISDSLARILIAGRPQFNARVVEAKHRYPALDTTVLAAFLSSGVDSVVRSVSVVAPERVAAVTVVAYDMALELVGQALVGTGARSKLVDHVWQSLIPRYAGLVSMHPMEVLGALTNAAINIGKVATARIDDWIQIMNGLAMHADSLNALQAIGQIAAWRSGLAHYRVGAIRAADALPESVALLAVGAAGNWTDVRDKLLADPWWTPEPTPAKKFQSGLEVGAFTGFGGLFTAPPAIRAAVDGFFVSSADRYGYLVADANGAVLLSATADEFMQATQPKVFQPPVLSGNRLTVRTQKIELDLPAEGLGIACNENTVAVTSPYSYSIRLFALR